MFILFIMVLLFAAASRINELEDRLKPKIEVSQGIEDSSIHTSDNVDGVVKTLVVRNIGASTVRGCGATLEEIKFKNESGQWQFIEASLIVGLAWARDGTSKDQKAEIDLRPGQAAILQIFSIRADNKIGVCTPTGTWPSHLHGCFVPTREYSFLVHVGGHDTIPIKRLVILDWRGEWKTAAVRVESAA